MYGINIQNIEFKSCSPVRKRNSVTLFRLWKFQRVISPSQTSGEDTMTIFINDLEIFHSFLPYPHGWRYTLTDAASIGEWIEPSHCFTLIEYTDVRLRTLPQTSLWHFRDTEDWTGFPCWIRIAGSSFCCTVHHRTAEYIHIHSALTPR